MSTTKSASPARSKASDRRSGTPIHIRAQRRQKDLIDSASAILGKTRSDFMLEAACREAEAVILDQRVIHLGSSEYGEFVARLDAKPEVRQGLVKLFSVRGPWER